MDGAAGALDEVKRIVAQLRAKWPEVKIVLRGDSGFCREELMAWCEADENRVDFLFGLARNSRLQKIIGKQMQEARWRTASRSSPRRMPVRLSPVDRGDEGQSAAAVPVGAGLHAG